MRNRDKNPSDWQPDINRSVGDYNAWYLANSPTIWANARGDAVEMAAEAFRATRDFRDLSPSALRTYPKILVVTRMAVSPTMARDRLVGFSGASKSFVEAMEIGNIVPRRATTDAQLETLCDFLKPMLDPGLFPWIEKNRTPTAAEKDRALVVLGERLTLMYYGSELRNSQEHRQKALMRAHLVSHDLDESSAAWNALRPGTFGMGRNVPGRREDGGAQNLPMDCVARPEDPKLPLVAIEMKSAGDFTNVNKRRKEESDKKASLQREHSDSVIMLLQLFGYFDRTYLGFEAAAGLDWAWDHRLSDFDEYLGLDG